MKETHDASVVKFDSVCVDLFFRQRRIAGKLIRKEKTIAVAGCITYKMTAHILWCWINAAGNWYDII